MAILLHCDFLYLCTVEKYQIIRPERALNYSEALESVLKQLLAYAESASRQGESLRFVRFFLSDAQHQEEKLHAALQGCLPGVAVSIVQQPPLDGSLIAALAIASDLHKDILFHSLRLTEDEAAGRSSYEQARILFEKYLRIILPLGLNLATHCVRTWIYVRDIDFNYAGLVKARNDVFDEEGLSFDTHYIASTGIGGATGACSALVAIDFLTYPGIHESDKSYLKALSHLSPTHDYGVAFERGVKLSNGHIFISGTASIDSKGRILHEGDVLKQAGRLLENIAALLREAGLQGTDEQILDEVPYFIVYLRNPSDYAEVEDYMRARFPHTQHLILHAPVCRPGWLIEMECEAYSASSAE